MQTKYPTFGFAMSAAGGAGCPRPSLVGLRQRQVGSTILIGIDVLSAQLLQLRPQPGGGAHKQGHVALCVDGGGHAASGLPGGGASAGTRCGLWCVRGQGHKHRLAKQNSKQGDKVKKIR